MWRRQSESKASLPAEQSAAVSPVQVSPGRAVAVPVPEASHLGATIAVKGEISGSENLYLDAAVHGTVRIQNGRVTVGPNGRVEADIEADEVVIYGQVTGNLHAPRVQLGRSGVLCGDMETLRLLVEEGAVVRGQVEMGRSVPRVASAARPSTSPPREVASASRPVTVEAKDSVR